MSVPFSSRCAGFTISKPPRGVVAEDRFGWCFKRNVGQEEVAAVSFRPSEFGGSMAARMALPHTTVQTIVHECPACMTHPEFQYLDLLSHILERGDKRTDRTGVGTLSVFGTLCRFDLSSGQVPILTTKRVYWKTAVKEMLW